MTEPTDRREILCAWLTANGIDPNAVPLDADLTIETWPHARIRERVIRCEVYVNDAAGRHMLNERGTEAAREIRTVPLAVEPPEWWTPHIKPTREQLLVGFAAVSRLHVRNANCGVCEHCSERDYPDYDVQWPCPTMQALGDLKPEATP